MLLTGLAQPITSRIEGLVTAATMLCHTNRRTGYGRAVSLAHAVEVQILKDTEPKLWALKGSTQATLDPAYHLTLQLLTGALTRVM